MSVKQVIGETWDYRILQICILICKDNQFHSISSTLKFSNLLIRSVESFKYDFCLPKNGRNTTNNQFPNFATGDEKVDTMGGRGTHIL